MRIRHHIVGLIALVALTLTPASAAPAAPTAPPEPQPIAVIPVELGTGVTDISKDYTISIAACPTARLCTTTYTMLTTPISAPEIGATTDFLPSSPGFDTFAAHFTDGVGEWMYLSDQVGDVPTGGYRGREEVFFGDQVGPSGVDLWGSQIGRVSFRLDSTELVPPSPDYPGWYTFFARGTISFYPVPLGFQISCSDATGYGATGERLYWQVEFINPNYSPNRVSRGVIAAGRTFNPQVRWRTPIISGESDDASYYRWWIWRGGHYGELIASSEGHFFCAPTP